eukprot:4103605-Pleurochrysis_carterae.AAC.6
MQAALQQQAESLHTTSVGREQVSTAAAAAASNLAAATSACPPSTAGPTAQSAATAAATVKAATVAAEAAAAAAALASFNAAQRSTLEPTQTRAPSTREEVMKESLLVAEATFEFRFIDALQCLLDHWSFLTNKSAVLISTEQATREARKAEALHLGRAVAISFVALVGKSNRCSYIHAFVYAFPPMISFTGDLLRASMEGFEHGNKVTKNITNRQTSDGGKKKADGTRFHRQAQALQHRREGTEAAHLEGRINRHSSATRQLLKGNSQYERKWNVAEAKGELEKQKLALLDAACVFADASAAD